MIRALVFDFDGLILDTETPLLEAWAAMHQEAGIPYARDEAIKIVGHVDIAFDPWGAFPTDVDRPTLDREHKKRSRELLAQQQVLPGVKAYLTEARARGLRLAVASNSHHAWIDKHLERLGLLHYFNAIKCRDDVNRGKPEPDVYQAVVKVFGIRPEEAIAFEDSEPGSLAAKAAGLWCVAVPNPSTQNHRFSHADLRLPSLAELSLDGLLQRFHGQTSGSEEDLVRGRS